MTSPHLYQALRQWGCTATAPTLAGVPLNRLLQAQATPAYIYSQAILDENLAQLRSALGAQFDIYYSIKANPHPAILRHFVLAGCGLELASRGELQRALAAGCRPSRLFMAGPGKTDEDLRAAIGAGIGELHLESLAEAARASTIAAQRGRRQPVAIRVNPSADVQGGSMRMGGRSLAFGIDEEELLNAVDRIERLPGLELCGIHLFAGTQIFAGTSFQTLFRRAVELAGAVADRIGRDLATIDFGGGLGVPYFPQDPELDWEGLARAAADALEQMRSHPRLKTARPVVEPGRLLTASAGVYLARVVDVKHSRGKRFVVLDGGMHHHLAASGNLGQVIKRNFPMAVLNRLDEPCVGAAQVVGPLCTPLDTVGRDVSLPEVAPGDVVAIFQSGAYSLTSSPIGFLSHALPQEIWLAGGEAIRLPSQFDHYFQSARPQGQILPSPSPPSGDAADMAAGPSLGMAAPIVPEPSTTDPSHS